MEKSKCIVIRGLFYKSEYVAKNNNIEPHLWAWKDGKKSSYKIIFLYNSILCESIYFWACMLQELSLDIYTKLCDYLPVVWSFLSFWSCAEYSNLYFIMNTKYYVKWIKKKITEKL